jgi:hypothetical protein
MRIIPDNKILLKLIKYWSNVLSLNDWQIVGSIVPVNYLEDEGNQGECNYSFINKQAIINLRRSDDWGDNNPFKINMEKTLIHELLHLKFAIITGEDEEMNKFQHQLLDNLAVSFLTLKEDK